MKTLKFFLVMLLSILFIFSFACKNKPAEGSHDGLSEGEEAGPRLPVNETYETVRKGVRLILAFDN